MGPTPRLNEISTLWSVVLQANQDEAEAARLAQRRLLERYGGAVRRYLLGALRDPDAADELFQEFALLLVDGDLRGADRQRGRFRDFVKGVLFHLVARHHRERRRRPQALPPDHPGPAVEPEELPDQEAPFRASWRAELLDRSWAALEAHERQTGQPFYTVLRFRADHPKVPSARMAEELGGKLGRALTAAGVRKTLERARDRFAELLLDEIIQTLGAPTRGQLEEELIELNLLDRCRAALERRAEQG
jgi:DNA-directed RNA polymerase specialized sigma24 family protein